jgi:Flp pilus assembly protein TadG
MSLVVRKRDRSRGQGLVEIALVLPAFLLALFGLIDVGRAIFTYNSVSEAARNGARVAIVNQIPADICEVGASRAVGLGLPTGCVATNAVGITVSLGAGCSPTMKLNCLMTVAAKYDFRAITPVIAQVLGPIRVASTSTVPVESKCTSGSCPKP